MTDGMDLALYFNRYAAAFDAFDCEAIADVYALPCLMIQAGSVAAFSSREALVANMKTLVDFYRAQGYQHARFAEPHAMALGSGLTLVTVEWTIHLKDLTQQSFRNTYELVEIDGVWRIAVSTTHYSGGISA